MQLLMSATTSKTVHLNHHLSICDVFCGHSVQSIVNGINHHATLTAGVGCCFLLKLEYYSSENLLKFISNKLFISLALFLLQFDKKT